MTVMEEISKKETEAIEELRKRLKNVNKPDLYEESIMFYRFLKARDFDIDNAEEMLRKHLEWRKENHVDTIMVDFQPKEVFEKYVPINVVGFDKEGFLVRYLAVGKADFKGLCMSAKFPEFERHIIHMIEYDNALMEKQSKLLGKKVDKCFYIFDFEEMSFAQATDRKCLEYFISLANTYQNNYPERLKGAFAINASMYFTLPFAIVKTCLASSVLEKVQIFGTDGWKEELVKRINEEELPAFLGGKKTDPDGNFMCETFINHGGKIPESYFIHKSKRALAGLPGVKKIVLSRAAFHEETIDVKEPESFLEWEFETKSRDIGFGLFFQDVSSGDEKMAELVPIQRIDTDEYAETGMYKCEKAGKYVMLFDNTYSWLRSKEIHYKTTVINPEDEETKNLK